jgi:hypothetical protein
MLVEYRSLPPPANWATYPRVPSLYGDPPLPLNVAPVVDESVVMSDELENL